MADQLCTPPDLASWLQQDLDLSTATLLVECGTAVVQEAAGGQRIIEVVNDVATLIGGTDSMLELPQLPVTAVASVTIDGSTVATGSLTGGGNYKRFGNKLWRGDGWQLLCGIPSEVIVVYTHGLPAGHQGLQFARASVLALCAPFYSNPTGASQVRIDDYAEAYAQMSAQINTNKALRAALRRQYGRRGGLVRIG